VTAQAERTSIAVCTHIDRLLFAGRSRADYFSGC
jgi:hypothetical protein